MSELRKMLDCYRQYDIIVRKWYTKRKYPIEKEDGCKAPWKPSCLKSGWHIETLNIFKS